MLSARPEEFTADLSVLRRSTPAEGVVVLELGHPDGAELPAWQPGAHIDLVLADNLVRQYSLCGDPHDRAVWRIGVLLETDSRGGSRFVHDSLTEGSIVRVHGPRNHFPLVEATSYRFIAGGIGITPIMAMVEAADRAGADWTLLYGGRTRASMAFAEQLAQRYPERVTVWPQDENGLLDLPTLLAQPAEGTKVYCCGPEALLAAVEQRCTHWPEGSLHVERFSAKPRTEEQNQAALEQFEVVCQRSGITLNVTADTTILDLVEEAGIAITTSCYEGVCGSCEARVIEGTPDHRDSVYSDEEKATNDTMLICISRSLSEKLVLDL